MRGNRGFSSKQSEFPTLLERIISALSYITMGFVGFIWIIIGYITGRPPKYFVRFHVFQSIFISIILYIFNIVVSILLAFVKIIPFIGDLILNVVYYLSQYPLVLGFSLLNFLFVVFIAILSAVALGGRYSEIPWLSNTIKRLL